MFHFGQLLLTPNLLLSWFSLFGGAVLVAVAFFLNISELRMGF
jgi:hypothetical protein